MPPPSVAAAAKRRSCLRDRRRRGLACLATWDDGAEPARRISGRPHAIPVGSARDAWCITARAAIVTCTARIADWRCFFVGVCNEPSKRKMGDDEAKRLIGNARRSQRLPRTRHRATRRAAAEAGTMTAMHRLLTTQDGVDLAAGKDAEYEAKRARALKWLEKNERDLDLDIREATSAAGRVTTAPPPATKPKRVRRKCSVNDISDDSDDDDDAVADDRDDDTDDDTIDTSENHSEWTAREVHRLMRLFCADDETRSEEKQKELEGCRNALRRARADPAVAPDEPVPLTVRPYDVTPGDESKDVAYVYRHALTTVGEAKKEIARRLGIRYCEALALVMSGRVLEDHKTLMECGVCARYVVYVKTDRAKLDELEKRDEP